jgi:beta-1,4-mannosyltransferase
VACLPARLETNPYQRLLYEAVARQGVSVVDGVSLGVGSLLRHRGRVFILHIHWPEGFYRGGRRRFKGQASLLVTAFVVRLVVARALGYHVIWTAHQVYPHERATPYADRVAALALSRVASRLIAHDETTRSSIERELGVRAARKTRVVPHGSYVGVYPEGRPQAEVRRELGLAEDDYVFLAFGHVRAYKGVSVVLEAFARLSAQAARLVVAGMPHDSHTERELRSAAAADPRIRLLLEYVPDERVAELFAAADAAVVARKDAGTSGALVLALSQGLPAVYPDASPYRELVGDAGWPFAGGDAELAACLETAVSDRAGTTRRATAARARMAPYDWEAVARSTVAVFAEVLGRRPPAASDRVSPSA